MPGGREAPRVGVVVLNHNGGDLTVRCLRSVLATDWPDGLLHVVLVDNASTDGIAEQVRRTLPAVTVVDARSNLGFAAGCNLGVRHVGPVDYVALLNNDATVEPGWLAPLVSALEADPTLGAACPTILFDGSFVDVRLSSPATARGRGDGRRLGVRLSGARVDGHDAWASLQLVGGFWGVEFGPGDDESQFEWTDGAAHLRVRARPDRTLPDCELHLAADDPRPVVVTSGSRSSEHTVGPAPAWYEAPLDGEPFDVVNNVGCDLLPDGMGVDRGYLEGDEGQYERVEEVFAWCGAAVVLSRRYLDAVGGLEARFFLYYEDFDLSWRGRAQGWRYVHVPGPPVRHVHSASTVEGSRLHHHYSERNRLLVLARNAPGALAVRATARYMLVTVSYARRDVVVPLLGGRRPSWETVRRRLTSFGSYLGALPAALVARRRLRRRQVVPDETLLGWQRAPGDGATT